MHKGMDMYSYVKIKVSNLIHTVEAGVGMVRVRNEQMRCGPGRASSLLEGEV